MLSRIVRSSALVRVLLCVLPLLLAGCSSRASSPSSPGYGGDYEPSYGGYDDGGYGEGSYDDYDDYYVEEEQAYESPPPAPAPAADREISVEGGVSRGRSRLAKQKSKVSFGRDKAAKNETSPDTVTTASGGDEGGEVDMLEPDDGPDQQAASQKRQIIYTATMQVSVYDVANAVAIAESLPARYGGWLHQRVDNQLVLRIPAEHLEQAMAMIAELGVVDQRLLEALDVTAEYTDLESRIRVLEEMQAHLQDLLKRATSVEQALEIRRVLDDITLELESARTQMRELAKSIAFSTLILRFVERGPAQDLPNHNDPFPWVDQLGAEATGFR